MTGLGLVEFALRFARGPIILLLLVDLYRYTHHLILPQTLMISGLVFCLIILFIDPRVSCTTRTIVLATTTYGIRRAFRLAHGGLSFAYRVKDATSPKSRSTCSIRTFISYSSNGSQWIVSVSVCSAGLRLLYLFLHARPLFVRRRPL